MLGPAAAEVHAGRDPLRAAVAAHAAPIEDRLHHAGEVDVAAAPGLLGDPVGRAAERPGRRAAPCGPIAYFAAVSFTSTTPWRGTGAENSPVRWSVLGIVDQ